MANDREQFPDDPIVAEVRRIREEYAKKFNYDMKAMSADIAKRREEFIKMGFKYSNRQIKIRKPVSGTNG